MVHGALQCHRVGLCAFSISSTNSMHMLEDKTQINNSMPLGEFKRKKQFILQSSRISQTNASSRTITRCIQCSNNGIQAQCHPYQNGSFYKGEKSSWDVSCLSKTVAGSIRYFDFSVIGSGIAGLRYALEVAKFGSVAVISKAELHECNTNYAQGGICAVLSPSDSVDSHARDTIVAGAYLCDEEIVKVVCSEGPERVKELIAMGASFDQCKDGNLHLTKEGGHSHHRVVHAADTTGREIEQVLLKAAHKNPNISFFEHHMAVDLLTSQDGSNVFCYGVDTLNMATNEIVRFVSPVTLLASGGAGHIYPATTNPLVATGDGIAMAHRAHALISNMEFVQFHPTALADEGLPSKPPPRDNAFLITEAVRGSGGLLYNQSMERFMPNYDARAELAPRDVVARSIDDQLKTRNEKYVLLDISHRPKDEILSHFPNIAAECLKYGLDITSSPIPVVPAAHYICGGVKVDIHGETSVKGLYAAGEVACTGLHGANRLASNSLLEGLVFACRAVEPSVEYKVTSNTGIDKSIDWPIPEVPVDFDGSKLSQIEVLTATIRRRLQRTMWNYVGIVRSIDRLEMAEGLLEELELGWEHKIFHLGWRPCMVNHQICELRNLFCCARLIVTSALSRHESRGLHFIVDFPSNVESQRFPTIICPTSQMRSSWSNQLVHTLFRSGQFIL